MSDIAKVIAQMGVPKKRRARKLRNERMQQIATLLYLYAELVPAGKSKERAVASLSALLDTVEENAALLPKANPARMPPHNTGEISAKISRNCAIIPR